ncbi:TetR/AcrR family transcriptional regulator [Virgibacillus sp. NKC19-3]|uniref:TetR/AcrR family transcriptional regulator n=1 Tax=Virgibacillus saliphilus TaxID=2831674 RepID=UPI001C9A631B|nr:TetR/AcrR family transcriptional regulator [Virgibacillus sp. NKC19-3]MBY7141969.1 TetR/AcrR family transcriptional regulator [Virgibacillus sp. NKC19-3]
MTGRKLTTSDRILQSALQLMKDKGFHLVTIKEIADAAQVSEMTVFRHFETKKGVLEAAVERNKVVPSFQQTFEERIVWDLEKDLLQIAHLYLQLMEGNESICLIAAQERTTMPELVDLVSDNTDKLKHFISHYFQQMQEQGKMTKTDSYAQASLFVATLFSYFISTALWKDKFMNLTKEAFITNSVHTFCYGLMK